MTWICSSATRLDLRTLPRICSSTNPQLELWDLVTDLIFIRGSEIELRELGRQMKNKIKHDLDRMLNMSSTSVRPVEETDMAWKDKSHQFVGYHLTRTCGMSSTCRWSEREVSVILAGQVKEHMEPPCVVLIINDNPYGLMVALSYVCRTCA
jgi:hypothetical protein